MAGPHRHAESAETQGKLWGGRARDWAEIQEKFSAPLYEAVLEATGLGSGKRVLDVGCGAGGFCALAAMKEATVAGLDASRALIEIARERTPTGDFRIGDMQHLPFANASFDVVAGFNSFQHAPSPQAALSEARRVLKPGGLLAAVVWGDGGNLPEAMEAVRESLAGGTDGAPSAAGPRHKESADNCPFASDERQAVFRLVREAGLTVKDCMQIDTQAEYLDAATMLRGMMSPGPVVQAIEAFGEQEVKHALVAAMRPFQTPSGGYRLVNRFVVVIATP